MLAMATTEFARPSRKRKAVSYVEEVEPPPSEADYVQPSTAKRQRTTIRGRSGSAPPLVMKDGELVLCYGSGPPMPAFHQLITDVSKSTSWNDPAKKAIRLPYYSLDPGEPDEMQGVMIEDPAITGSTCTELPLHLAKIQTDLTANIKTTSATEATGEAAAALCVCRRYPSAQMLWGAHVHSGAGIDQIWHLASSNPVLYPKGKYIIVEAKGVGAALANKNDPDIPPAIQQQMSIGWVYHNLVTMERQNHAAAKKLMKDIGLTEELVSGNPFYYQYNKRPKSYYNCQHNASKQKAELWGLVVEASWTMAGQFNYKIVQDGQYL
jgi:hypothetical protein